MIGSKKTRLFFNLVLVSSFFSILNFLIVKFVFPSAVYTSYHYSIFELYTIFTLMAFVILFVLEIFKRKHPEQVGYVFLLATTIKMALCYVLILPILNNVTQFVHYEKINFFVIFILFLAIEVIFTSKLLNDTKQTG